MPIVLFMVFYITVNKCFYHYGTSVCPGSFHCTLVFSVLLYLEHTISCFFFNSSGLFSIPRGSSMKNFFLISLL